MKSFRENKFSLLLVYALGEATHCDCDDMNCSALLLLCIALLSAMMVSLLTLLVHVLNAGLCVMCGRQSGRWNVGFGKLGLPLFSMVCMAYFLAFSILTCSFAELISIVPFSGGCYAYTRCALGSVLGYLAGVIETAKYLLFAVFNIYRIIRIFHDIYDFSENYDLLISFSFLLVFNILHWYDLRLLWWVIGIVGAMILIVQFLFIFGATTKGTTANMLNTSLRFDKDLFLVGFSYCSYLLSAVDAVRTCVDDEGTAIVPKALVHVLIWSILVACASVVAEGAYTMNDQVATQDDYSYNMGLSLLFPNVDPKMVTLFSLPGCVGCSVGFLYCCARQVQQEDSQDHGAPPSSSRRGIMSTAIVPSSSPSAAGEGETRNERERRANIAKPKPVTALFSCSISCLLLLFIGMIAIDNYGTVYTYTAQLLASLMYIALMLSYIVFSVRFSNMERTLRSPFGNVGALLGIVFYIMLFVVNFYFNPVSKVWQGVTIVTFLVLMMVYYSLVVKKRQFFSKEAQDKFMKAYVVNANKTRRRAKTGSKSGVTKSVSSLFNAMLGMSTTGGGFSRNHASSRSGSRAKEISSADDISNNRIGLAAPSLVANNSVVPYYHLPN
eukprot:scaffold7305_cov178-Ochromonas_danica.AAC.3